MNDWTVTQIHLDLEAVTGIRVGGERGGGEAADMPLLRLPDERPYVPGSSLKGVLRSSAERLLSALPFTPAVCDVLSDDRCGGRLGTEVPASGAQAAQPASDEQVGEFCWVCRTFGSPHKAGRLFVGDLLAAPDVPGHAVPTVVRDGVGIDRNELCAASGVKYDFELVPPGVVFAGTIRLDDASDADLGLLIMLCDLLDAGLARVGGSTTRGLGYLRYHSGPVARRISASQFIAGLQPELVDLQAARAAARAALSKGEAP